MNGNGRQEKEGDEKSIFSLDSVDYPIFQSPYGKFGQKDHAGILYNGFKSVPDSPRFANITDSDALLLTARPSPLSHQIRPVYDV